jgi:hypothetical protein
MTFVPSRQTRFLLGVQLPLPLDTPVHYVDAKEDAAKTGRVHNVPPSSFSEEKNLRRSQTH